MTDDLDGAQADLERAEAAASPARPGGRSGARPLPRRQSLLPARRHRRAACEHHGQSLDFARACGSAELEAAALGGLGDADYVRGRMISAQAHYERCVALCREHGLGRIEAAHRQMLGLTRFFCNDVRGALADALGGRRGGASHRPAARRDGRRT